MGDYWQENKRFLSLVGYGLLIFGIGWLILDGMYGGEVRTAKQTYGRARIALTKGRYSLADRDLARDENDALKGALADLGELVTFSPRPAFVLPSGNSIEANRVYRESVERVRENLAVLAGRKRISLPQGLDLEMVKTNSFDVIERQLHALDLLERALTLAIEYDVKQIKRITLDLDPAFSARRGLGPVELSTVRIEAVSTPQTVTAWLQATQTHAHGQVLPIGDLEARTARAKQDELRVKVTFNVVRVHLTEEQVGPDGLPGARIEGLD